MIPYQKWHSSDWLGSRAARVLNYEEQGMFRALLDIAWDSGPGRDESPPVLADNAEALAWELGIDVSKFKPIWKRFRKLLVASKDGTVHSRRQMQEYLEAKDRIDYMRDLGRKGGEARGKRSLTARLAHARRTASGGLAEGKRTLSEEDQAHANRTVKPTVSERQAGAKRTPSDPDPDPDSDPDPDPEPTASRTPPRTPPHTATAKDLPSTNGDLPRADVDDLTIHSICQERFDTQPTKRQLANLRQFLCDFYPGAGSPAFRRLAAMMAFKRLGFGFLAESLEDPDQLRVFEMRTWAEIWAQASNSHGPGCRATDLAVSVAGKLEVDLEELLSMIPPSELPQFQEAMQWSR